MAVVTVDFETYYSQDYSLSKMSEVDYVLDPRFQTIMCTVKIDAAPAEVFIGYDAVAKKFSTIDWSKAAMLAHNTRFDGSIAAWHYSVTPALYLDTMAMSRATVHAVTGRSSLKALSDYLGLPPKGDEVVRALGKRLEDFAPAELAAYADYCVRDCENTYEAFQLLRRCFSAGELRLIDIVLRMFIEPQVQLDAEVLAEHLNQVRAEKAAIMARVAHIDRSVFSSNQKFATLLEERGVEVPRKISPTTGQETYALAKNDRAFKELCQDDTQPLEVQALLAARVNAKSTIEETRTQKLLDLSLREWPGRGVGWAPVPLKYSGARTHRLSGDAGMNWQNFKRGSRIRQAVRAPDGYRILHRDASQIEARMVAWLAYCHSLLSAFAEGRDVYSEFATGIYGRPITKADKQERFVGKTCLAAGTRVLTNRGIVVIERVQDDDLLWDGVEWVHHDGLVAQGQRETLTLSGVSLTPDHRVWSGIEMKEAWLLSDAVDGRFPRSVLEAANLPSSATWWGNVAASSRLLSVATAGTNERSPTLRLGSANLKPVYDLANVGPRRRFTILSDDGPVIVSNCILGLGYNTGWEKLRHTLFIGNGGISVSIDEKEAKRIVYHYRQRAYPEIPQLWHNCDMLLLNIVARRRPVFSHRPHELMRFNVRAVEPGFDAIWLPNGLCISYPNIRFDPVERQVVYDDYYGGVSKIYGGKATENISQALSRIVVTDIAARMYNKTGVHPFLSTHDSLDYCVPHDEVEWWDAELEREFAKRPDWAPDLPLASEGGWGQTLLAAERMENQ